MGALLDYYDWIKVIHILALISWMAGLLYLPRLFVYHCDVPVGSAASDLFKTMEYRLLRYIMTPAMIVTWVAGLLLAGILQAAPLWLILKIVAVVILSGVHGWMAVTVRKFRNDQRPHPARFYRIMNEVPTILMIVIVILVVIRPFG